MIWLSKFEAAFLTGLHAIKVLVGFKQSACQIIEQLSETNDLPSTPTSPRNWPGVQRESKLSSICEYNQMQQHDCL